MVEYNAPIREYDFLFNEVFDAIPIVQRLGYDFDSDFLSMLTEGWADQWAQLAEGLMKPAGIASQ